MDMNRTLFSSVNEISSDFASRLITYEVCADFPPTISSEGIWAKKEKSSPLRSSLTILQLQIITIFVITQSFHFVFKRLGIPLFVSQFMAGFILGPSIKIEALDKYKRMLFPYGSEDTLSAIGSLGYTFFMFLCCVKMDFSMIGRTGRKVWGIALSTLLVPIVLGFIFIYRFEPFFDKVIGHEEFNAMAVVVITHSGVSFAVIATFLDDLKLLNSELGRLALSSALVADVIFNVVSGTGTAVINGLAKGRSVLRNVALLYSFIILIPLFGRPAMKWVVRNTPEGRPVKNIYTYTIIVLVLVFGYLANLFYQPFMAGAVVLGLAVPEGPPLGSALVTQLEMLASWFLLPLFVTTCTMKLDLSLGHRLELVLVVAGTIFVVHLIKSLLCVGISWYCKMPTKDGLCLAMILCCKGVVDVCTVTILLDALKMSREMAGIMMMSVFALQCVARFAVQSMYDPSRKYAGYQKRNIMSLKPGSELRLVACIHKPCHIIPVKNLLELCCPTSSQPIVADVLHLMQLIGRSSPMFISHRVHNRINGSDQYNFSGDVIVTFNLFEHDHSGAAVVNTFTVVSPLSYMHEDVCHMALDKLASIIVLPFHIRWGNDGSVESEDRDIRALNCKILSRAPCSVGILVNRGFASSTSSRNRIAMIFIGGHDDREALCLAKRATKDFKFTLAVYHLTSDGNDPTNWDRMLDFEVLKDVKKDYRDCHPNVMYEELFIDDASKTTDLVKRIANEFDYILVGRRHGVKSPQTAALVDWTEFSELGAIGDLLASPDTPTRASILVVQHQQMPK